MLSKEEEVQDELLPPMTGYNAVQAAIITLAV